MLDYPAPVEQNPATYTRLKPPITWHTMRNEEHLERVYGEFFTHPQLAPSCRSPQFMDLVRPVRASSTLAERDQFPATAIGESSPCHNIKLGIFLVFGPGASPVTTAFPQLIAETVHGACEPPRRSPPREPEDE